MPDTDHQPLHEVVRALLGLRSLLHGHTGAWWALRWELDTRYGRQAVEAEFLRQLGVRHGYQADVRRPANEAAIKDGFLRAVIWVQNRMGRNNGLPWIDQIFGINALLRQATPGSQMVDNALIEAQHLRADKAEQKRLAATKPKPPKGRVQMESDPPQEAGAQMCRACNGTGEVQGEWQGGPAGLAACEACNGEGMVAQ